MGWIGCDWCINNYHCDTGFCVQKYSNHEAVLFEDSQVTYSQLYSRGSRRVSALEKWGVTKSDHVGTLFFNCMEAFESFFAIWKIGAVLVPLSFQSPPSELHYVINQVDLSTIILNGRKMT